MRGSESLIICTLDDIFELRRQAQCDKKDIVHTKKRRVFHVMKNTPLAKIFAGRGRARLTPVARRALGRECRATGEAQHGTKAIGRVGTGKIQPRHARFKPGRQGRRARCIRADAAAPHPKNPAGPGQSYTPWPPVCGQPPIARYWRPQGLIARQSVLTALTNIRREPGRDLLGAFVTSLTGAACMAS